MVFSGLQVKSYNALEKKSILNIIKEFVPAKIDSSASIQLTHFRSSQFNDQRLNKSRIQQSEGQFKESYRKNISKTNI